MYIYIIYIWSVDICIHIIYILCNIPRKEGVRRLPAALVSVLRSGFLIGIIAIGRLSGVKVVEHCGPLHLLV
jgi:hypothetical protein